MIISRYLMKEVFATLLAVTLVLLLLLLSNQLVRYLSYAAAGKIAAHFVLQLLGLEIPYLLALLLPLGLYIGIILAYGRLYADSELPVLNACGLGTKRLIKMTSVAAFIIAILVSVLMLWVNPLIAAQKAKGLSQEDIIETLQPGRFHVIRNGHWVAYVEKMSRGRKQADNIFIAEERPPTANESDSSNWMVVSAAKAYQEKDPATGANFIVSANGYRYDGTPGKNAFKIIQFKKYAVRIPLANNTPREEQETISTPKLWRNYHTPAAAAELQWRLAMPISVLILALLAVPLSQVRPRQGRYSHLFPALLIYIIYVNLLFVSRNWVELNMPPAVLGMWWVHGVLLALALFLLLLQTRYQLRPLPFSKLLRRSS